MAFLTPLALLLSFLAIPIILLYMLRLRRREQTISSTLLWRDLVKDRSANVPWQRLRRNLLLILQLLILAALVFALARPVWQSTNQVDGHLIVLLDSSASMQATDGESGLSRYTEAVAQIGDLIDGLTATDSMTIIAAGRTPAVLAAMTNDPEQLRDALATAKAENVSTDWMAAFTLASASAQGLSDPRIVIISDGGLPDSLPPLPGEVTFLPVGQAGDNLAISAMAARPSDEYLDMLITAANSSGTPKQALLSLYLDDVLFDTRRVELGAGQEIHQSWRLPIETNLIEARLETVEGSADYLAIDDRAWTVTEGETSSQVLLNTEGNLFLERLFSVLPGYEVMREAGEISDGVSEDNRTDALLVFDGVPLPEPLPAGNILLINPQPANELPNEKPTIQVSENFSNTAVTRVANIPLLAGVDWSTVNIAEARMIGAPELEAIVESEGGPLLLAGEVDGRRIVILPFDLHHSDLPLQIAFPILMANIMDWLNPGRIVATNDNLRPGDIVPLFSNSHADSIQITLPDGDIWETTNLATDILLFDETSQTGVYTLAYRNETGQELQVDHFAVNFFKPEESRIQPPDTIKLGQVEVTSQTNEFLSRRELWPILVLAGFGLLLYEWWITYRKGSKKPFLKFR